MSPREKLNPNKTQRTSIEDISPFGEELSEERLRLVSGGLGLTTKPTYYPSSIEGPIRTGTITRDDDNDEPAVLAV